MNECKKITLDEVIELFKDRSCFLLTINGVCDEWYNGVNEIQDEEYYPKYKDKKVTDLSVLVTNGEPELCIRIEK